MPELYGQPYKYELREEICQLRTELWNVRKDYRLDRLRLNYANAKIEELEATIKRMEQKAAEIQTEASKDVDSKVKENFFRLKRRSG